MGLSRHTVVCGFRRTFIGRGWTLIELLVVIAIIALLLTILLPTLSAARAMANSMGCLSNLRALGQAMHLYVTQNDDYLPGSGWTTARHIWNDTGTAPNTYNTLYTINTPGLGVTGHYDYIGPLARAMGLTLDCPADGSGKKLFEAYRTLPIFLCPSNREVIAYPDDTAPAGSTPGQMLSYCTAAGFMLKPFRQSSYSGLVNMPSPPPGASYWALPPQYVPKLARIGDASHKVFLADSARLTKPDQGPTFTLGLANDHLNNPYSDFGPFYGLSRSFDRSAANGFPTSTDPRIFAYRHGIRRGFQPAGRFKLNVLFFDGHAQTMDDLESADPNLWLPQGTIIYDPSSTHNTGPTVRPIVWPDIAAKYLPGVTNANPYTVPW